MKRSTNAGVRFSKRVRINKEANGPASTSSPPLCTLLDILDPIKSILCSLFTDSDAGRVMRVSKATTFALLSGYEFEHHVFEPLTEKAMWSMRNLYARYQLRVINLQIYHNIRSLQIVDGISPVPSSCKRVAFGSQIYPRRGREDDKTIFRFKFDVVRARWIIPENESKEDCINRMIYQPRLEKSLFQPE